MQQSSGMSMAYPQQGVPPPPNQPPPQQQYQVAFVILYVLRLFYVLIILCLPLTAWLEILLRLGKIRSVLSL